MSWLMFVIFCSVLSWELLIVRFRKLSSAYIRMKARLPLKFTACFQVDFPADDTFATLERLSIDRRKN